jgi:hypothetical protein
VHDVSRQLHVVTWEGPVDAGGCPSCSIGGFYAEYVCTPR